MRPADRAALDAENQRVIDEALADATPPREWHGPLLVTGAQRRREMIEAKGHVCLTPSECGHYEP